MTGTTLSSTAAPPQSVAIPRTGAPMGELNAEKAEHAGPSRWRLRDDARTLPFLCSMILHTLFLVILALFTASSGGGNGFALLGEQSESSPTFQLEQIDQDVFNAEDSALAPQPVAIEVAPSTAKVSSPIRSNEVAIDLTPDTIAALRTGGDSQSSPLIRLPGGGLASRTPEGRAKSIGNGGSTGPSERAVEEALRWIAEHQRPNGSWSFNLNLDPCNGRCQHSKRANEETPTPSTGATGLALLAFLGAGYTHEKGPYQETVKRGLYYLRSVASEAEAGYDWQQGSMYGHGIALMAAAEALAMSSEKERQGGDLPDLVNKAAWFTVVAQHNNGSWGYVPGSPGDTTLTGWQVLSLLAAKRSGAPMGTYTFRDARDYVMSTSKEREYSFGYQGPPGEPTTTAIGLTLMLYLGQQPGYTPFYNALTEMAQRGPQFTNVYHDYYATLALHHSRHPMWEDWYPPLREFLVAKQAKSGHEKGSWHFKDKWGDVGGRLYTTAMCAMILEVSYRYQPLYAEIEKFPL